MDVAKVEMLDSNSLWHIRVRQSRVELFRSICPWQIISGDVGEVGDLGKPGVAERKV